MVLIMPICDFCGKEKDPKELWVAQEYVPSRLVTYRTVVICDDCKKARGG